MYADGKPQPIETKKSDGFIGELSYFIECVKSGTRPTRVTAADAVAELMLIEAEKKSIQTGERVMF